MTGRPAGILIAAAAVVMLPLIVILLFLGTAGTGTAGPPAAATAAAVQAAAAGPVTGGGTPAANKALAAGLAAGYGWAGTQVTCLDDLWTRESSWLATAKNPTSGAYGIAQALGHLAGENQGQPTAAQLALNVAGDNYPPAEAAANPPPYGNSDPAAQITWGLGYIAGSYGTPCSAWQHETADGFY